MYKRIILFVLCARVTCNLNECDFEEDECGWFSGESIGVAAWARVTTQELVDGGVDVHPSADAVGETSGHYMFAHTRDDAKIFSISSPKENNETCMQFIFNAHVRSVNFGKKTFRNSF